MCFDVSDKLLSDFDHFFMYIGESSRRIATSKTKKLHHLGITRCNLLWESVVVKFLLFKVVHLINMKIRYLLSFLNVFNVALAGKLKLDKTY